MQQRCHHVSASARSPSWPPMPRPRLQRAATARREKVQLSIREQSFLFVLVFTLLVVYVSGCFPLDPLLHLHILSQFVPHVDVHRFQHHAGAVAQLSAHRILLASGSRVRHKHQPAWQPCDAARSSHAQSAWLSHMRVPAGLSHDARSCSTCFRARTPSDEGEKERTRLPRLPGICQGMS
jgi:hypothetical protein